MAGLDGIELTFGDKTRHLRFPISSLRDLCAALGGITLLELLTRLGGMDVNAILQCLRYGLIHEEPRLTIQGASSLLEAHIRQHGDASRVLTAISESLEATGLLSLRAPQDGAAAGEARGGPGPA